MRDDTGLSIGITVMLWGAFTLVYLIFGSTIGEVEAIGTLTIGDLALAVLVLGWIVIVARWFVLED
jgi:hypothetical protein